MSTAPGPEFLRERLPLLDILRGFALPGILLMNIEWFSRHFGEIGHGIPAGFAAADRAASWLIFVFVQGKFWLLFSLLFGAGFTVMRQRLLASGRPFLAPYLRRCLVLGALGVAHGVLLWSGDILHSYAVAGLMLLAVVPLTERGDPGSGPLWRLALGGAIFVVFTLMLTAITALFFVVPHDALAGDASDRAQARAEFVAERDAAIAAYRDGSWAEATAQRRVDFVHSFSTDVFVIPVALGVFLMGGWLLDSGRLSRPQDFRTFHRRMLLYALPAGLAITVAGAWHSTGTLDGETRAVDMLTQWTHWVGAPLMTLGYVGGVTLLALRPAPSAFLRRWLAPSGQMALTNYLMASAIGSTLFYGYGAGLWGQVSRVGQVGLVAAVLVLQCLLSAWWLARFRYGPVEWLWRAATWLQWPPMRR